MKRKRAVQLTVSLVLTVAMAVFLLLVPQRTAAISITGPLRGDHDHSVNLTQCDCGRTCVSGTSTLNPDPFPDPFAPIGPPAAGSQFMNTFVADQAQYPGWTAVTGTALNGTLNIDEYKAVDRMCSCAEVSECFAGGALMEATYTPGTGDLVLGELTFIQMWYDDYSENPPHGCFTYHIDPFLNDDTEPFYYTAAERATYGLQFVDNPCDWCTACPQTRVVGFDTYMCSWDAGAMTVTVHDGWSWGYDLECEGGIPVIPEPATMLGVLLGFCSVGRYIRKRAKARA